MKTLFGVLALLLSTQASATECGALRRSAERAEAHVLTRREALDEADEELREAKSSGDTARLRNARRAQQRATESVEKADRERDSAWEDYRETCAGGSTGGYAATRASGTAEGEG